MKRFEPNLLLAVTTGFALLLVLGWGMLRLSARWAMAALSLAM